ncbi:hypothetical protein F5884DRAFT_758825 [Xylogone sp. PMI_703]|nr:hypothetical protein F5884DRAFT_758825 [Xylogone sp. PMI_703]
MVTSPPEENATVVRKGNARVAKRVFWCFDCNQYVMYPSPTSETPTFPYDTSVDNTLESFTQECNFFLDNHNDASEPHLSSSSTSISPDLLCQSTNTSQLLHSQVSDVPSMYPSPHMLDKTHDSQNAKFDQLMTRINEIQTLYDNLQNRVFRIEDYLPSVGQWELEATKRLNRLLRDKNCRPKKKTKA